MLLLPPPPPPPPPPLVVVKFVELTMQLLQDDLETILIGQWKLEEQFHQIGRTLALLFLRRLRRPPLLPTHHHPHPLRHRRDCSTIDECCDVE